MKTMSELNPMVRVLIFVVITPYLIAAAVWEIVREMWKELFP